MMKNAKVTLGKRPTIADMIHSHIARAKRFDKDKPFRCTCGKCAQGNPQQMDAEDIFPSVFKVSNKFTPTPNTIGLHDELKKALTKMLDSMVKQGALDKEKLDTFQV